MGTSSEGMQIHLKEMKAAMDEHTKAAIKQLDKAVGTPGPKGNVNVDRRHFQEMLKKYDEVMKDMLKNTVRRRGGRRSSSTRRRRPSSTRRRSRK
jgi:hypothetical protein